MLKPIVSMNQMAMNESIATTCCYKWNGVSITGSATVLHGGNLNASYTYDYYYPDNTQKITNSTPVSNAWFNVPLAPTYAYKDLVKDGYSVPYKSAGEWYVDNTPITQYAGTDIIDTTAWKWVNPDTFYTAYKTGVSLEHVGSTSAHYKYQYGNEWLADHAAVQYSS